MKAVILAGGAGTRLSEETATKPKPMVEIGGKPILWHIMSTYARQGITEFVVCLGYKGYVIKEWFANYLLHNSDVTIDLAAGSIEVLRSDVTPWKVTLIETGADTLTGGRVKRALPHVGNEPFHLTYGDGVADVDLGALMALHRAQGSMVTVTAVQPPGRFGNLTLDDTKVTRFSEKEVGVGAWINGGYFVVEPGVGDYIAGDETVWEREPLERLADEGKLSAYRHHGFWHPMDTLRDKRYLDELWDAGDAPWSVR